MAKKKFYAVFSGSRPGVYMNENEARKYSTDNTRKSIRSYNTEAGAYNALNSICKSKFNNLPQMHESHYFLVFEGTQPGIYKSIDEARRYSRTSGKSSIKEYHRKDEAEKAYNKMKRDGKIVYLPPHEKPIHPNINDQSYDVPNADTIAAIQEVQRLKADPDAKTYSSFEDLLRDMDLEANRLSTIERNHGHGHAYIDGSYSPKNGKYGYGVVLHYTGSEHGEIEFYGSESDPSEMALQSAAGEILAVKAAVTKAVCLGLRSLTIYHDFENLATWANSEPEYISGKPQKDYSLFIERMRNIIYIEFIKVSAHSGILLNEKADFLARKAIL